MLPGLLSALVTVRGLVLTLAWRCGQCRCFAMGCAVQILGRAQSMCDELRCCCSERAAQRCPKRCNIGARGASRLSRYLHNLMQSYTYRKTFTWLGPVNRSGTVVKQTDITPNAKQCVTNCRAQFVRMRQLVASTAGQSASSCRYC